MDRPSDYEDAITAIRAMDNKITRLIVENAKLENKLAEAAKRDCRLVPHLVEEARLEEEVNQLKVLIRSIPSRLEISGATSRTDALNLEIWIELKLKIVCKT